ncbi:MAG: alpha/beta fold hydrolase, partial [Planctomycetota bacterium]
TYVLCHPYPLYGGDMYNKVLVKVAGVLARKKYAVLRYNMRGVGASTGSMAVAGQDRADLSRILQWLLEKKTPGPVRLAGYSYGAYIAMSLLSQPDTPGQPVGISLIRGIITIACPYNLPEFRLNSFPGMPIEIIQGTHDELIPAAALKRSLRELDAVKEPCWVQGADHCFNGKLLELEEAFLGCVERMSGQAGS